MLGWPGRPKTYRYRPPTRTSAWHSMRTTPAGAHQRRRSSGFVMASKTVPGRARNQRRTTSSRPEARSTCVPARVIDSFSFRWVSAAMDPLLFLFELGEQPVEHAEALVPQVAVA